MAVEVLVDVLAERLPEGLTEDRLEEVGRKCAEATVRSEGREGEADELSIVFVDDVRIRDLNARYLGKDEPTDVLAFSMTETTEDEPARASDPSGTILGDVVVSVDTAVRQAAEFGNPPERELALLVIHGTLHLLGYDDCDPVSAARMASAQDRILSLVGL